MVKAIDLLRDMNEENKRKLSDNASLGFIPRRLRDLVVTEEGVTKPAWECSLARIIAHGYNLEPDTMFQLKAEIGYAQFKRVTDWQLTEDA